MREDVAGREPIVREKTAAAIAEKAGLSRESLYRMLSRRGNPEIKSLLSLLHVMGLRLSIEAEGFSTAARRLDMPAAPRQH